MFETEMKQTYTIGRVIRYGYIYSLLLIAVGFVSGLAIRSQTMIGKLCALGAEIVTLVVLVAVMEVKAIPWLRGAMGETVVRGLIRDMYRSGVRGLEDVRYDNGGKANIDHIAVAPSGVWVIEVKYWNAEVACDSQGLRKAGKPYGAQILKGCFAASKKVEGVLRDAGISAPVKPVLVIAGQFAKVNNGSRTCDGVIIIGRSWLRKIVVEDGPNDVLTSAQVNGIHKLLGEKSLI